MPTYQPIASVNPVHTPSPAPDSGVHTQPVTSKERSTYDLSITTNLRSCPAGTTGIMDVIYAAILIANTTSKSDLEYDFPIVCGIRLTDMVTVKSPRTQGDSILISPPSPLRKTWIESMPNGGEVSQDTKLNNLRVKYRFPEPYAVFAGEVPRSLTNIMVGGALRVRLILSVKQPEAWLARTEGRQGYDVATGTWVGEYPSMYVALRTGGIPAAPKAESLGEEDEVLMPQNIMTLYTDAADEVELYTNDYFFAGKNGEDVDFMLFSIEAAQMRGSDTSPYVILKYTWTLAHPHLPGLAGGGLTSKTYFRVGPTSPEEEVDFELALSVKGVPCPPDYCVHGHCVQYLAGEVRVATCTCRYPWGGERCSERVLPESEYVRAVLTLTLTNLAVVPSVVVSFLSGIPVLAAVMAAAATSSAVYHLCDLELWCAGDALSFQALQVLDVLLSTLAMATTIMHLGAISSGWIGCFVVVFVAVLLPPIVDSPTSPSNIYLAVGLATVVWFFSWVALAMVRIGMPHYGSQVVDGSGDDTEDGIEMTSHSLLENRADEDQEVTDREAAVTVSDAAAESDPWNNSADVAVVAEDKNRELLVRGVAWTLAGLVVAALGFTCFFLQDNAHYWIMHSLWHIGALSSVFFLVKGRSAFVRRYFSLDKKSS